MEKMVFSKNLTGAPLGETAARLAQAGLPALELTVRAGEAIEPARVAEELPALAENLRTAHSSIGMICTQITSIDAPHAEAVLRTAASLGVRSYRLGEWRYQGFGTLRKQRKEVQAQLLDLAAMNREIGIQGLYQNHSNPFFGAVPADLDFALDSIPPSEIGVYFDPVHAVIEGGSMGWMMGMDILSERIAALGVKDYRWLDSKDGYAGARRHSMRLCPLGTGNVPWAEIVKILRHIRFDGPVSFYGGGRAANSGNPVSLDALIDQLDAEQRWLSDLFESEETNPNTL